ncbi:hypothetical protein BT93_F1651 [Corymbia citriodora subsp. variegata]|nr:hypothetical protein BT93_F1651 [Corymbia citriodora subsp. variegata]
MTEATKRIHLLQANGAMVRPFLSVARHCCSSNACCRGYVGFKRSVLLDHKRLVVLLDSHQNGTLSQNNFLVAVHVANVKKMAQLSHCRVIVDKPKKEDYFYADPLVRLCEKPNCDDLQGPSKRNSNQVSS